MDFVITLTPEAIGFALLIFALRVFNYAISTIRLVFIGRGVRIGAAVIAFVEALIFAVVIANVVRDLSDLVNLFAYCLGAAVGSYVGMWLEARFIVSYSTVTIITHRLGAEIAEALRNRNYGVTVSKGEGRDGEVDIIRSTTINRDVSLLVSIVQSVNPDAFIDVEAARSLYRGWIPGGPPRRRLTP
ncbi:MAG: DUF5698 domain-containing protein [Chloroflexota bacterium]